MTGRVSRRDAARLGLVVAIFALVGVISGFVWERLWSPATGVVVDHGWGPENTLALQAQFSGTGWYVVVAAVAGLVVGVLVAALVDEVPLLTLAAVVVGSVLAAWVMLVVGTTLGPDDPTELAKTAADGTRLPASLEVSGRAPFVAFPMGALAGLLVIFLGLSPRLPSRQPTDTVSD